MVLEALMLIERWSPKMFRKIYLGLVLTFIGAAFVTSGCSEWRYYQHGKGSLETQGDQTECENRVQVLPEEGRKGRVLPTDRQITECMKEKGYGYVKAPLEH
ncbi:MAG: hypothetical protein HY284_07245 [Nitrospirae bacterium]|nr:hypothetical protein [Nitrospirota bacterium]